MDENLSDAQVLRGLRFAAVVQAQWRHRNGAYSEPETYSKRRDGLWHGRYDFHARSCDELHNVRIIFSGMEE